MTTSISLNESSYLDTHFSLYTNWEQGNMVGSGIQQISYSLDLLTKIHTRTALLKWIRSAAGKHAQSQLITLLCVWHTSNWQAMQQKGHVRTNGNSAAQLNARIPGTESMQTGLTSCHLVPSANRLHFANPHIIQEFHLTHSYNDHLLLMKDNGINIYTVCNGHTSSNYLHSC